MIKKQKFFLLILIMTTSFWCSSAFATFSISPTVVRLKKDDKVVSLSIKSLIEEERHFQLELFKIDDTGAKHGKNNDLLVTPVMFKIGPGKTQLIRVAKKQNGQNITKDIYELSIKSLPHGEPEANAVRFITDFRVKVYIGHDDDTNKDVNKEIENNIEDKDKNRKKDSAAKSTYGPVTQTQALYMGNQAIGNKTAVILALPVSVSNLQ